MLLGISNVTLALLYISRDVDITGGVDVVGSIEVFDEDGVTVLTNYTFDNFTGGEAAGSMKYFYINNTGNQPVYITWNISSSSLSWDPVLTGYSHSVSVVQKYSFMVQTDLGSGWINLAPNDYASPTVVFMPAGNREQFRFNLQYTGDVNTAEIFTLTVTFYAQDS